LIDKLFLWKHRRGSNSSLLFSSALSGDRVTRTGVLVLSEADHALKFYMAVVTKSVRFLNLSTKSGSGADHALKLFF